MLTGSREEARALNLQLTASKARASELNSSLAAQINEAAMWHAKARRRGWIIAVGVGVPAAIGLYTILK